MPPCAVLPTQFASSIIDLGQAVDTPAGSGVIVVPRTPTGIPTPIQLEFNTVTAGGTTTASVTDVGPAAPFDYDLLAILAGKPYVDISTSAQFAGRSRSPSSTIPPPSASPPRTSRASPAAVHLRPGEQLRLGGDQRGLHRTSRPTRTADARYFRQSGQSNPDTTNHIIYGVTSSLGTFALTSRKSCWSRPPTPAWARPAGPAQLTTDPALLQRNRGQPEPAGWWLLRRRRRGLASCLFDGLARRPSVSGHTPFRSWAPRSTEPPPAARLTSTWPTGKKPAIASRRQPPSSARAPRPSTRPRPGAVTIAAPAPLLAAAARLPLGPTVIDCNANDDASNRSSCQTRVRCKTPRPHQ